ncbi:hypothetical protein [Streptosporangium sp. NPDC004631]
MEHLRSAAPNPVIPGWRVILSDAGRFWASRVLPFPNDSEWYAPPFRTVDADTFDELRTEVDRQETAARQTAGKAGQDRPGGQDRQDGWSGQVKQAPGPAVTTGPAEPARTARTAAGQVTS